VSKDSTNAAVRGWYAYSSNSGTYLARRRGGGTERQKATRRDGIRNARIPQRTKSAPAGGMAHRPRGVDALQTRRSDAPSRLSFVLGVEVALLDVRREREEFARAVVTLAHQRGRYRALGVEREPPRGDAKGVSEGSKRIDVAVAERAKGHDGRVHGGHLGAPRAPGRRPTPRAVRHRRATVWTAPPTAPRFVARRGSRQRVRGPFLPETTTTREM